MSVPEPQNLAPYATLWPQSRGRLFEEKNAAHRSPFQRDRDRIIHCGAFRRLKHKTQVFVEHEGDYYRTRLTHSLEVAQIARTLARALRLDEDLAEALSLAHDLGHSPFGHAGETALDAAMRPYGGFDHNGQALRIVTELEGRYAEFDGLNLSWETLEGLVKHNGPVLGPLAYGVGDYNARYDLELASFAGPEAQIAALSDDLAYCNHDLDDGLRAKLFDLDEVAQIDLVAESYDVILARHPDLRARSRKRFQLEVLRRIFGVMVDDVLSESCARLAALGARDVADIRAADAPVIAFSDAMAAQLSPLRRFLFQRMYRHSGVNRVMSKAKRVVKELFELFMAEPNLLPEMWRMDNAGETERARKIADYIAGMTDRFALQEHRELFDTPARLNTRRT